MRVRARSGLVASYALVVLVLVTLNFFLPRALPGQPIQTLSDPRSQTYVGDAQTRLALERYYGLDRPLPEQYGRYMADLATGDLGTSIRRHAPVADVLGERIGWTLLLVGTAVTLGTAVGMVAGVRSGWRRGRRSDRRLLALLLAFDNRRRTSSPRPSRTSSRSGSAGFPSTEPGRRSRSPTARRARSPTWRTTSSCRRRFSRCSS